MASVKIKGMSCQHCVASVTKALSGIDGVTNVVVNLQQGEATYETTKAVAEEAIRKAITGIGFEVVP